MREYKKVLAAVLAIALLTAFTDVPKTFWGYDVISRAEKLEIVHGRSEKIFDPSGTINKQEIAQIVVNVYGRTHDVTNEALDECVSNRAIELKQSKSDSWAYPVVAYGFEKGFWKVEDFKVPVNNVAGGTSMVTRQMMAQWICDSMGYKTFGLRVFPYVDNDKIDPAYYSYVDAMYKYDIMHGGNDYFRADEGMTRAEATAVGVRMYDENNASRSKLENNPIVFEKGLMSSVDKKLGTFKLGDKLLQIADDAVIIVNGQVSDFSAVAKLEGKQISASMYIAGDNTSTVIIQSSPVTIAGKLVQLVKTNIPDVKNSDYKVATIEINGKLVDFVINSDSEVLGSLTENSMVQFISDGVYILEIE